MDHRLRQHADYQRVYKSARKQFGKQIAWFHALRPVAPDARPSVAPGPRVGLTVPKALGKAVDRNRIKRRLRECVRKALPLLTADVDVVLHPKRSVLTMEFGALEREVTVIFRSVQAACERGPKSAERPRLVQGKQAGELSSSGARSKEFLPEKRQAKAVGSDLEEARVAAAPAGGELPKDCKLPTP